MHKYSVVEFVTEGAVDVVVTTWIFSKDGRTLCHWPPAGGLSQALKRCEPPNKSWPHYDCRQLYSTGLCSHCSVVLTTC